jgi:predicted ArsR family transcriptional regulator
MKRTEADKQSKEQPGKQPAKRVVKRSEQRGENSTATVRTRRAIINLLKQESGLTAEALALKLNITGMGVRQHLYALQQEQLVNYREEPPAMGRPAKLWQLTPAANSFFPEGYAELTLGLIDSMKEAFGEEGLTRLLEVRATQQLKSYQAAIPQNGSIAEKLTALAVVRTREGYMAEVRQLSEQDFLFIENHCPICTVAVACTGLCANELMLFQSLLGAEAKIERSEHIVIGAHRCVYQVTKSKK